MYLIMKPFKKIIYLGIGITCRDTLPIPTQVLSKYPTQQRRNIFDFHKSGKMNFANSTEKNFFFTSPQNEDKIEEFIKVAVDLIRQNKTVLLFTHKQVNFVPFLTGLTKEQMQNLIISYHSDAKSIIHKLLEQHNWTILPDLVLLDLNWLFDVAVEAPPLKTICFCISALFSYMRSVVIQKNDNKRGFEDCGAKSVTLLNAHPDMQIQLLVDFYFYKNSTFNAVDEIKNAISDLG